MCYILVPGKGEVGANHILLSKESAKAVAAVWSRSRGGRRRPATTAVHRQRAAVAQEGSLCTFTQPSQVIPVSFVGKGHNRAGNGFDTPSFGFLGLSEQGPLYWWLKNSNFVLFCFVSQFWRLEVWHWVLVGVCVCTCMQGSCEEETDLCLPLAALMVAAILSWYWIPTVSASTITSSVPAFAISCKDITWLYHGSPFPNKTSFRVSKGWHEHLFWGDIIQPATAPNPC